MLEGASLPVETMTGSRQCNRQSRSRSDTCLFIPQILLLCTRGQTGSRVLAGAGATLNSD